jgi:uncharacterized protein YoaH (UPF0181 family)
MAAFLTDGTPVSVERQRTWDGDVFLTLVSGDLVANRCESGRGDYRIHHCRVNSPKLSFEQHQKAVEKALTSADKLAETRLTPGSRGATIVLLAEEIRRLRAVPAGEREAVDQLLAGYKVHIDDLSPELIRMFEALEQCRKRYYM